ncbi:hypothetical protein [Dactylosporangium sp. CA-139066]|uniref:hypothetical protein n=1 Tax=Dactylosporangium sp. CA-139066 TaxID=3239930 RepID=UPI003D89C9AD
MITEDADADLRRLAADPRFPHGDAARRAIRFRARGSVADLVAIADDPHPCGMTEIVFALAGTARPWLNWVPMPAEAITGAADRVASRRAKGEAVHVSRSRLSQAEPATAMIAARRLLGPFELEIAAFPEPDLRRPLRRGRYAVWRYDGEWPVPVAPAPPEAAVRVLHEVAEETWPSMLSGYLQAAPLGALSLGDLLGLLGHLPEPPATPRWQNLARSRPTYWYRLMQPWVCLGLLRHAEHEPWATSTRREVLVDLAFGVEDWVSDAALFALVTAAYREPAVRPEVRRLVRARLDAGRAARRAGRNVTIGRSLAELMLVTPGRTALDRIAARRFGRLS